MRGSFIVNGVDLNAPPPPNYIAGLGRGATGFTTKSDVSAPGGLAGEDLSESNFDRFSGYGQSGLGNVGVEKDEDREADRVYEAVEQRLKRKRRDKDPSEQAKDSSSSSSSSSQKKKKSKSSLTTNAMEPLVLQQQFSDLKRALQKVDESEWDAIPEPVPVGKSKSKKDEMTAPAPDSVLLHSLQTAAPNLNVVGAARQQDLEIKMKSVAPGNESVRSVDKNAYLTGLETQIAESSNYLPDDVANNKRARLLLKSLIQTNPHHPRGYIAAARAEEVVGDLKKARQILDKGIVLVPSSEDVWLEAIRLSQEPRALLTRAVLRLPYSIPLWKAWLEHAQDTAEKKTLLKKALTLIPSSVDLWQMAVELEENESDAHILLSRAVECVPDNVDLWIALARTAPGRQEARLVLNKARKHNPAQVDIWLTAACLEEAYGAGAEKIMSILQKCKKSLVFQIV